MSAEQRDIDLEQWVSTYSFITTQRILSRYQIQLPEDMLLDAVKNQFSFYHHLIKLPLKHVLNGIVLQQTHDYYVYAQKLYIDYLMSADCAAPEEAPGASVRDSLESERTKLIALGEAFHQLELAQDGLIGLTQAKIIQLVTQWKSVLESTIVSIKRALKNKGFDFKPSEIRRALHYALIHCDLDSEVSLFVDSMSKFLQCSTSEELQEKIIKSLSQLIKESLSLRENIDIFLPKTIEMNLSARSFRTQMYDAILVTMDLLKLLPTYKIDLEKDRANRESLYFDKSIG